MVGSLAKTRELLVGLVVVGLLDPLLLQVGRRSWDNAAAWLATVLDRQSVCLVSRSDAMRRFLQVFMVVGIAAAGVAAAAVLSPSTGAASPRVAVATTTHVKVTMTDFKFKLSRTSVPTGTVVFTVVNKGKIAHDFKIAGKKTAEARARQVGQAHRQVHEEGQVQLHLHRAGPCRVGHEGQARGWRESLDHDHDDDDDHKHDRDAAGRSGRGPAVFAANDCAAVTRWRPPARPAAPARTSTREADPGDRARVRPERLHGRRRLDAGVHQPEPTDVNNIAAYVYASTHP